ncbi:unnamed protein product, partial [Pylaiella littoralis]
MVSPSETGGACSGVADFSFDLERLTWCAPVVVNGSGSSSGGDGGGDDRDEELAASWKGAPTHPFDPGKSCFRSAETGGDGSDSTSYAEGVGDRRNGSSGSSGGGGDYS